MKKLLLTAVFVLAGGVVFGIVASDALASGDQNQIQHNADIATGPAYQVNANCTDSDMLSVDGAIPAGYAWAEPAPNSGDGIPDGPGR